MRAIRSKLQNQIDLLEDKIDTLNTQLTKKQTELAQTENEINSLNSEISSLSQTYSRLKGYETIDELGDLFTPETTDLDEITNQLLDLQDQLADLIAYNSHFIITKQYRIDGSEKKGQTFQKNYCENLIIGFNSYFTKKLKAINSKNYNKTVELIEKTFTNYNKKGQQIGITIAQKYLDIKLSILRLTLEKNISKQIEKEKIRKERQRLKEEQQLLLEAEKERKRLEEERKNLQKLFAKAVSEQEQEDIKNKLAEVDKRTEEIDWRISHQSTGWLYIATTPCLEGMYKAGCTRQLNPLNRLAQLSSASVPYPFECRGLVFSEDVFDLEAKLHKRLDSVRVNKMNRGKEFFYGLPEETIKILKEEFKVDVHFINENWVEEE